MSQVHSKLKSKHSVCLNFLWWQVFFWGNERKYFTHIPALKLHHWGHTVPGGSVLFQCRILSGIPNPQVEWKFNGNANSFDKNVEILANGGVIRITNVQKSNEGRFECTASNLAGQATVMAYLGVLIPPTIEMTPTSSIQVNFKDQLISECPFDDLNFPKNQRKKFDKFLP